jgi:hypothetical protein
VRPLAGFGRFRQPRETQETAEGRTPPPGAPASWRQTGTQEELAPESPSRHGRARERRPTRGDHLRVKVQRHERVDAVPAGQLPHSASASRSAPHRIASATSTSSRREGAGPNARNASSTSGAPASLPAAASPTPQPPAGGPVPHAAPAQSAPPPPSDPPPRFVRTEPLCSVPRHWAVSGGGGCHGRPSPLVSSVWRGLRGGCRFGELRGLGR